MSEPIDHPTAGPAPGAQPLSTADIARADQPAEGSVPETRTFSGGQPDGGPVSLFPDSESTELRSKWTAVQASFVDEPRKAVEEADALVAVAMKRLAEMFAAERSNLEGQWDRGDNVSTEDLRVALTRYRAFFDRLLSV